MVNLNQELGDCDLCIEFAHFLSNFITLKRKKKLTNKSKNPVSCHHFDTDVSFVSRVNTQGNLSTAPAEFDVTFDFAIFLCSQKYNRKFERSKHLPNYYVWVVT